MKENGMPQDFQTGMAWDPAKIVIDALPNSDPTRPRATSRVH